MSAPVETLPKRAPPVLKPVPVQEVAFVELQVRVEDWPESTGFGEDVRDAVGVGLETFTLPPPPETVQAMDPEDVLSASVTVTEPDFETLVEYVFCTLAVVPVRPSVPLAE